MVNVFLEIQRLRYTLEAKGLDRETIEQIAKKAESDINAALNEVMFEGLDEAVSVGVQKGSPEFINELRPRAGAFEIETSSGNTDFTDPPRPMLDDLLKHAKPMKDGSGVYKVIPIGKPGNKPPIHTNIFDAQKAIMAERHEEAQANYKLIRPTNSKIEFRTATSKQNRDMQWVRPAVEKNFAEELHAINDNIQDRARDIVHSIIQEYEDLI